MPAQRSAQPPFVPAPRSAHPAPFAQRTAFAQRTVSAPFVPAQRTAPLPFAPVPPTAPPAGLNGPNPHPTPTRHGRSRVALLVAGGVVATFALLAAAGVTLVALAGLFSSAPPARAPIAAPAQPAPSQSTPSQAQAVSEWYQAGGRQILGALAQDFQNAGAATDLPALRVACTGLQRHVEFAQAYFPIPDVEAHRYFASALDRYAAGADYCLAGIRGMDSRLITQAGGELTAGTEALSQSTRRIADLSNGRPI